MGSGRWSTNTYAAAAAYRAATGVDAFDYDSHTRTARPRDEWTAHPTLDPLRVSVREARDADEHPTSLPIAVLFDVTGSMGTVPRRLQQKLPQLFGLLQRKRYVDHPQILFGPIGDATCDQVPLQIGQFESDNRMDEHLGNILLEGGGGGQKTESYELAAYFMARHTALDSLEKRGKRGYLFIIGDEMNYPRVYAQGRNAPPTGWSSGPGRGVAEIIGDRLPEDIPTPAIYAELKRRYDVFFILPAAASYGGDREVLDHWRGLLGQNVIELDNLDAVCETIALIIGMGEDAIDLADGLADLDDIGSDAGTTVGRALATIGTSPEVVATSMSAVGSRRAPGGDDTVTRL
jgi:hypothetical protein